MATPPDFTTGQVLTAAQMNAVGLWLVKTQTIGSAVSSVVISNCFTTDYDDYLVRISDVATTADNADFNVQLRTGTTNAATGYKYVYHYVNYATQAAGIVADSNGTAFNYVGRSTNNSLSSVFDVSGPRIARRTVVRALTPGGNITGVSSGYLDNATTYDGLSFTITTGTMTGGTIRVYGYRK